MENNFNQTELRQIINRALAKCMNLEGHAVNTEMNIFCSRYIVRQSKSPQDMTQATLPKELSKALNFCDDLEEYRQTTDVYSEQDNTMSEMQYRRILSMLSDYDKDIFPENKAMQHLLENNIKRHLPEYQVDILLDGYNDEADRIYKLKKEYEYATRKKQPAAKDYEKNALNFFKELFTNKDLHAIKTHPKKVTLYEKCIRIVNCLPASHYNRTAKYKLKKNLNYGLFRAASLLGEEYLPKIKKARLEMERYEKAIEKTQYFSENPPPKRKLSTEEYNRQKFEEWYYR
ncbi:MAG: hypothetical protein J6C85_08265 [Alphaproteobacteria bacterium]|nr:hypothetical protein [Alphaproteobacteria bacterium]